MMRLVCALGLVAVFSVAPAQFLRASSYAQISNGAGNLFQLNEDTWTSAAVGTTFTRNASVENTGGSAHTTFSSEFGRLRGRTQAFAGSAGPNSAQSHGNFASFTNFIGAGFFDTITLTGTGAVSLRIHYQLHTINVDPSNRTFAQTQLKVDTFSSTLGRINASALNHEGAGERTTSDFFVLSGVAGNTFDLMAELSSLSSVNLLSGDLGNESASSDVLNTGLISITAESGSFTSASGANYAPVPEPTTWVATSLGFLALARRRHGLTKRQSSNGSR